MSFPVDDAHRSSFTFGSITHDVFAHGDGPGVLILHELPGMTPECLNLAEVVRLAGYRVYLPLFFGSPGQDPSKVTIGLTALNVCVRREFRFLATKEDSPITPWLRALSRKVFDQTKSRGKGIGVIGLCLTGGFVLALMLDEHVLAPVMCEPSLPLEIRFLPGAAARRAAIGIPTATLEASAKRAKTHPLLGYRFSSDTLCRAERFETIGSVLKSGFVSRTIPTGPEHPGNIRDGAHAVLTEAYDHTPGHPTRNALDEILVRFARDLPR